MSIYIHRKAEIQSFGDASLPKRLRKQRPTPKCNASPRVPENKNGKRGLCLRKRPGQFNADFRESCLKLPNFGFCSCENSRKICGALCTAPKKGQKDLLRKCERQMRFPDSSDRRFTSGNAETKLCSVWTANGASKCKCRKFKWLRKRSESAICVHEFRNQNTLQTSWDFPHEKLLFPKETASKLISRLSRAQGLCAKAVQSKEQKKSNQNSYKIEADSFYLNAEHSFEVPSAKGPHVFAPREADAGTEVDFSGGNRHPHLREAEGLPEWWRKSSDYCAQDFDGRGLPKKSRCEERVGAEPQTVRYSRFQTSNRDNSGLESPTRARLQEKSNEPGPAEVFLSPKFKGCAPNELICEFKESKVKNTESIACRRRRKGPDRSQSSALSQNLLESGVTKRCSLGSGPLPREERVAQKRAKVSKSTHDCSLNFKKRLVNFNTLKSFYMASAEKINALQNEMHKIKAQAQQILELIKEFRRFKNPQEEASSANEWTESRTQVLNFHFDIHPALQSVLAGSLKKPCEQPRVCRVASKASKQPKPQSPLDSPMKCPSGIKRVPYVLGSPENYVLVKFIREKKRKHTELCALAKKIFRNFWVVFKKIFWNEEVQQKELDELGARDRIILEAVFIKKKIVARKSQVSFAAREFNELIQKMGHKRTEQNLKCVFNYAHKFLRAQFRKKHKSFTFRKENAGLKNKALVDLAFYTHYFGRVADEQGWPISRFYHPKMNSADKKKGNEHFLEEPGQRAKTINRDFIGALNLSEKFIQDFEGFLRNEFPLGGGRETGILEQHRITCKEKLVQKVQSWTALLKSDEEVGLQKIVNDLRLNEKCKLPWSIKEISRAVKDTLVNFSTEARRSPQKA